mgnify:CR=1 FL=1
MNQFDFERSTAVADIIQVATTGHLTPIGKAKGWRHTRFGVKTGPSARGFSK